MEMADALAQLIHLDALELVNEKGPAHTAVRFGDVWLTLTLATSVEDPRGN